jgi:hypothetical protein
MMTSCGPIADATPPHPDNSDSLTLLAATAKRMTGEMPAPNRTILNLWGLFIDLWLEQNFTPLSPDCDLSFEAWIESRPYPLWKKEQLKSVYDKMAFATLDKAYKKVKIFMKDEVYPDWKHGRGIYARVDEFKCLFGPLCSRIEEVLYEHPEYIKHIPVKDRPAYIESLLGLMVERVAATDFTSFEMSFSEEIMLIVNTKIFQYFTQHIRSPFLEKIFRTPTELNWVSCVFFKMGIQAKRMSGEMDTSMSNTTANILIQRFLIFLLNYNGVQEDNKDILEALDMPFETAVERDDYISKRFHIRYCGYRGDPMPFEIDRGYNFMKIYLLTKRSLKRVGFMMVAEGDDGLMQSLKGLYPQIWHYEMLGFNVKIEKYDRTSDASFCGIIYHPDDKINVTDPRKTLSTFGWASKRYARASQKKLKELLRSKAMCFMSQYPGCPIIQSLAQYGLRVTAGYNINKLIASRNIDEFTRQRLITATLSPMKPVKIGDATRVLVEQRYGISIEKQLQIEKYLDTKNDLKPLELDIDWPAPWVQYHHRFVHEARISECKQSHDEFQRCSPEVLDRIKALVTWKGTASPVC